METKNITKEIDIKFTESSLNALLNTYLRMISGAVPATDETKKHVQEAIKDICDTISRWVDVF